MGSGGGSSPSQFHLLYASTQSLYSIQLGWLDGSGGAETTKQILLWQGFEGGAETSKQILPWQGFEFPASRFYSRARQPPRDRVHCYHHGCQTVCNGDYE